MATWQLFIDTAAVVFQLIIVENYVIVFQPSKNTFYIYCTAHRLKGGPVSFRQKFKKTDKSALLNYADDDMLTFQFISKVLEGNTTELGSWS